MSHHTAASHQNNFGLLRLVFATLVIVSHSFELIDGNRAREPLTQIFGTFSIAEIAVAGFFIVSGYLIAQSFSGSNSISAYLLKRVLRIYPAYIVASLFCIVIVGPLAGADLAALSIRDWGGVILRILTLQVPRLPNAFAGQHYPSLNGSMWTISYEFRCYLTLAVLGYLGLIKIKTILPLTAVLLICIISFSNSYSIYRFVFFIGDIKETLRLTALFLAGTSFFLIRNKIIYLNKFAILAMLILCILLFNQTMAGPAVAVFGGYIIFWFAFLHKARWLNVINSKHDLSYGIYLYAWPIQMLLIRYVPDISPQAVILLATLCSTLLAYFSWTFVEQPALKRKTLLRVRFRECNEVDSTQGR